MPDRRSAPWRHIWKDPVGGSLIAAAIFAASGYVYSWTAPVLSDAANWMVPLAILAVVLLSAALIWFRYRRQEKVLVFLSSGGTCRDPMAKVIMEQLLQHRQPRPRIKVRAAGLGPLSKNEASYAARYVIRELYGQDLLRDHRPELLTSELAERADLILAMDHKLLPNEGKTLPKEKTFLLKEFLGGKGDVEDPYPDGKDTGTIDRYRACAHELKGLLTEHMDRIVDALEV